MAQTFENLWRQARNLFPGVPALVVREWAQDAYVEACDFHAWGFLRSEGVITTQASRTLDVTVTQGSTTVTSAGLFVASDQGRQFRVGTFPIYTVRTFTDVNTIVLDKVYQATGGATTATILDAYAVMPADFGRFLATWNPYEQRPIPWWFNLDQLTIADTARTISDAGPRFLIAYAPSQEPATFGQVRYELHPAPTSARQFTYLYKRTPERLADATLLPGLFLSHTHVLKHGITLKAAMWPGTTETPNPYFNLGLHDRLQRTFDGELQKLSLQDDDQYPDQYLQVDWARLLNAGVTHDTNWLRRTDAGLEAYV